MSNSNRVAYNRAKLEGKRFSSLIVLRFIEINKLKRAVWLCRCDCGKEIDVETGALQSGNTKTCGCNNVGRFVQSKDKKVCRKCFEDLIVGNNFLQGLQNSHNWICKSCKSKYDLKFKEKNPFINHASSIKKYGINATEYENLYNAQNGCCKICKDSAPLHSNDRTRLYVDHCHNTKKVRGLLCKNCNSGLGQFRENVKTMQDAIKYLNDNK
jgi:hypothetical protein